MMHDIIIDIFVIIVDIDEDNENKIKVQRGEKREKIGSSRQTLFFLKVRVFKAKKNRNTT
jgi:hypothetical protein